MAGKLTEVLAGLPGDMILSDGGRDRTVADIIVDEAEDTRRWTIQYQSDGRAAIHLVNAEGYIQSPAWYRERRGEEER